MVKCLAGIVCGTHQGDDPRGQAERFRHLCTLDSTRDKVCGECFEYTTSRRAGEQLEQNLDRGEATKIKENMRGSY